jgi:hypothetical protein
LLRVDDQRQEEGAAFAAINDGPVVGISHDGAGGLAGAVDAAASVKGDAALKSLGRRPSLFKGILNVARSQALSRADFALKMLDCWKVRPRDSLSIGPAIGGEWPLDCELELGLAKRVLNTPLLGADDVSQQPFVEDSPHNP